MGDPNICGNDKYCNNCQFWREIEIQYEHDHDEFCGECRINPPRVLDALAPAMMDAWDKDGEGWDMFSVVDKCTRWPITHAIDHCGKFAQKSALDAKD